MSAKKTIKRTILPEQFEEAAKLTAIFDARSKEWGFKQWEFARDYGLKSQQNVNHYLRGYAALNVIAAVRFAQGLLCSVSDFSPRLAKELESMGLTQRVASSPSEQLTPGERCLLEFYRALGKEGKWLFSSFAESVLASLKEKKTRSDQLFFFRKMEVVIDEESVKAPHSATKKAATRGLAKSSSTGASNNAEGRRKSKCA
jgi:hypothetical protein